MTAPEVHSLTVHNFTAAMSAANAALLEKQRSTNASGFVAGIRAKALGFAGYIAPTSVSALKFMGSAFGYDTISGVDKHLLAGEGKCVIPVTLYHPANATAPYKTVVYYARKTPGASAAAGDLDDLGAAMVAALTARGFLVAVPDLCGFGETGDAFVGSLGGQQQASVDMVRPRTALSLSQPSLRPSSPLAYRVHNRCIRSSFGR